MPGLAGLIRLQETAPPVPCDEGQLSAALVREPDYRLTPIVAGRDGVAIAFAPGLLHPTAGAAFDEPSGVRAGFYGEFYGRGFRGLDGAETAQQLIRLYAQHGENVPRLLDGSFVVFISDARTGTALLFNDYAGSRPVYYAEQNGCFYFSPEPKGIARLPGVKTTLDDLAVLTFLSQGNLLNCQTYYREIRALPPGSLLRIAAGHVQLDRYYEYVPCGSEPDRGVEYYVEQLSGLLRAAVAKRAHHAGRAVVPISGGFDSRGILACLSETFAGKLRTVSWGTDETTPGGDAYIGRTLARRFSTEHRFLPRNSATLSANIEEMVERVDGMTADPALHYGELQAMRVIRHEVGGEYLFRGDEVFGFTGAAGDEREAMARIGLREVTEIPALVRLLLPTAPVQQFHELLAKLSAACPLTEFTARKDYYYFYQRTFNYLHRATYYKLTILDVGNPWLDKDILDFYGTVPVHYRIDKLLYRRTLSTMFPDLMALPVARRHSLENWRDLLAGDESLQRYLRAHLIDRDSPIHEFVDRASLDSLLCAAIHGGDIPGPGVRLAAALKRAGMRHAPAAYGLLKRNLPSQLRTFEIPPYDLLFRLLVLKLWFDRSR